MLADLIRKDEPDITGGDSQANNPSSLDLVSVVALILAKERRYVPDSLYPFISYVIDPATGTLFVRKVHTPISDNPEELTRIVAEAFEHQRNQVTQTGQTIPGVRVIKRNQVTLDVEYVLGIETYTLNRQLRREMGRITTDISQKRSGYDELEELTVIRRALIHAQLTRLAEFQHKPYVPRTKDGAEIIDNPDVTEYHREFLTKLFTGKETDERDHDGVITDAIDVITNNLPADDTQTVRYLDTYPRNNAIRTARLGTTLADLRQMIKDCNKKVDSDRVEGQKKKPDKTGTLLFMYRKLRHFDFNKVTRKACDLEDFIHITDDPGLSLTLAEQWEYYKIFLGTKQTLLDEEDSKPATPENDRRRATLDQKLASMDRFTDDEIEQLAPDMRLDRNYFLAVKAYRNLRTADIIERAFLAKYLERMTAAKQEITAAISAASKTAHAEEIGRFQARGYLKELEFMTRYLSDAKINDSGLYATGIRYDPQRITSDFYQLFEGDNEVEQQQNSLKFVVALSRYVHARMRYNEYIRDRRSHLERANEALRELSTEKIRERKRLMIRIGTTRYDFKTAKKGGIKIERTLHLRSGSRRYKDITGYDELAELYRNLQGSSKQDDQKAKEITQAYILRSAIKQKLDDRTYIRQ